MHLQSIFFSRSLLQPPEPFVHLGAMLGAVLYAVGAVLLGAGAWRLKQALQRIEDAVATVHDPIFAGECARICRPDCRRTSVGTSCSALQSSGLQPARYGCSRGCRLYWRVQNAVQSCSMLNLQCFGDAIACRGSFKARLCTSELHERPQLQNPPALPAGVLALLQLCLGSAHRWAGSPSVVLPATVAAGSATPAKRKYPGDDLLPWPTAATSASRLQALCKMLQKEQGKTQDVKLKLAEKKAMLEVKQKKATRRKRMNPRKGLQTRLSSPS